MHRQHRFTLTQVLSFILFVVNLSILTAQAQNLPPARYDGFVYENRQGDLDSILIEAFFDPVCPDSRDSWASSQRSPLNTTVLVFGSSFTSSPYPTMTMHMFLLVLCISLIR
ncbi:hypothetical protein OIU74_019462 [Salix koriyanagi]|uniref:Uncharacterized protein n=1 Tax=Salix koriyanagi TaxID=2511006 RepID=A0A9Q0SKQ5_9ROSI|nr:hypothetical protein OIU74_019462 [Salix koriyanagi]